uniref:Sulfatase N-terminal domain-containing protein n=1 Tax=Aureoumbra lagunensis TaxID=44058 RepID=A0A7S3NMA2_9STRA|mmetsp:Transcript_15111/g.22685  ORF Transcript_15111/g.22685 Transcript_15111/m.22685 type:complete len:280 (+) Transcript_15111:108-947(+)
MKPPNLIMALIDDFGWFGGGWQGNELAQTPFLDTLVREESLILERHYTYKFCSPSRRSFLTGRFPPHSGQDNGPDATIDYRMQTIAELLKCEANYVTIASGKWHGGHFSISQIPHARGFDESFGYFNGKQDHFFHYDSEDMCLGIDGSYNVTDLWDTTKPTNPNEYSGQFGDYLFTSRVLQAISKNSLRNTSNMQPFFIYWAMQIAHDPMQAPISLPNTPDPIEYAFATLADQAIENVTTKLKELEQWNNTLFVFSSDNGGPAFSDQKAASNFPLRGEL